MKRLLTIAPGHGYWLRRHLNMDLNLTSRLGFLGVVVLLSAWGAQPACAAPAEGVALAIVYDTSGSMRESVRDSSGRWSPKYKIGNRALEGISRQIEAFIARSNAKPMRVDAALLVFNGQGTRQVVPWGRFDGAAIRRWAKNYDSPGSGTPLGAALRTAGDLVLHANLTRNHVLVITDGMNTVGANPTVTMPQVLKQAQQRETSVGIHFVAFDIDAKVFDPLKRLGATVAGAADEKQLNAQLDFILQTKILLEDEEPPQTK